MDKTVEDMFNQRDKMLKKSEYDVPKQHETLSNLGNFLGKTILNTLSPIAKELMGVEAPLPVAPKTLWISPNDRFEGKKMLKPPPNDEVVKALTHIGILEIGSKIEDDLERRCEAKINAVRKEVENFERFECINRVKFATKQEQMNNEKVLKDQRLDLLDIFQKDRDELIEANKVVNDIVENAMVNDGMVATAEEKSNFEHTSINDKMKEMNDSIRTLMNEIDIGKKKLIDEVEHTKVVHRNILRSLVIGIQKQYMNQIQFLENKHNAEIRHIYDKNQIETFRIDSEESDRGERIEFMEPTDDDSIMKRGSYIKNDRLEFNQFNRPFVVKLSKVEGECSQDDNSTKLDSHGTGSTFKCYRNHSKQQKSSETSSPSFSDEKLIGSDSCGSIKIHDIKSNVLEYTHEVNTIDISCNIIRLLGAQLNLTNIENVKKELTDLISKYLPRSVVGSKLLQTTDSLDIIADSIHPVEQLHNIESMPLVGTADSRELAAKKSAMKLCMDVDEPQNKKNANKFPKSAKTKKILESKQIIHLTEDEYINSLKPVPKYMRCNATKISIWDYRTMTDQEWTELIQELEAKQQNKSYDTNISKTKTVTVNSSIVTNCSDSVQYFNSQTGKPIRGILRSKSDIKIDADLLENEIFKTKEIQTLVNKLNE